MNVLKPGGLSAHTRNSPEIAQEDAQGGLRGIPDDWVELPRRDLAPRRWRTPEGSIVGEAINAEAIQLLKTNPDEYFRRTRSGRRFGYRHEGVDQ